VTILYYLPTFTLYLNICNFLNIINIAHIEDRPTLKSVVDGLYTILKGFNIGKLDRVSKYFIYKNEIYF